MALTITGIERDAPRRREVNPISPAGRENSLTAKFVCFPFDEAKQSFLYNPLDARCQWNPGANCYAGHFAKPKTYLDQNESDLATALLRGGKIVDRLSTDSRNPHRNLALSSGCETQAGLDRRARGTERHAVALHNGLPHAASVCAQRRPLWCRLRVVSHLLDCVLGHCALPAHHRDGKI